MRTLKAAAVLGGGLTVAALLLSGCVVSPAPVGSISSQGRLAEFPTEGLPLTADAVVRWNAYQVPFIEAQNDDDAAFLLGMVHTHLRRGQMELLRRVSQARLAEMAGPIAADIDHTLRALNLGKASPQIEAMLPEPTARWLARYVEGINAYRERRALPPVEAGWLGLDDEPWTVRDVITVGRLASVDVNWLLSFGLLGLRGEASFDEVFARAKAFGEAATPSFGPGAWGGERGAPIDLLAGLSKSGSNAVVVNGARTGTGAGLILSDPHVGVRIPALWTLVGYSTPGNRVLGFSIAGLPAVLVGRNEHIAWGGTNMIGLSSSFFDVSSMRDAFTTRTETIGVRFWFDRTARIVESPLGPVLSRTPMLENMGLGDVALKWRGHEPSDEFSAFLGIARAKSFEEFRAAFEPYAVSGQNFVFADDKGNIGQVLALEYDPAAGRTAVRLIGDPADPAQQWGRAIKSTDLPYAYNPDAGYLISANNTPVRTDPPVTLLTNANDRVDRFAALIESTPRVDVEAAKRMQQDVHSIASIAAAKELLKAVERAAGAGLTPPGDFRQERLLSALAEWDGAYSVDSRGASAYQLLLYHAGGAGWRGMYGEKSARFMLGSPAVHALFREDLEKGVLDAAVGAAVVKAAADFVRPLWPRGAAWGQLHKLEVAHPLGALPLLGERFVFATDPTPGSSTTIFKSAHSVSNTTHTTQYGANARHISDLSDPDANYFSMIGGQDGWFGSDNFLDMYALWKRGEYVKIPLSPEGVRGHFGVVMEFGRGR